MYKEMAGFALFNETQTKMKRPSLRLLKGILHPKMKILSSFTHPTFEFLSSAEHKGRYFEE